MKNGTNRKCVLLFSWEVYLKTRYLFSWALVSFILNRFFMFQYIAVTTLDRALILELLPLPQTIVIISHVVCVILIVTLK